MTWPATYDHGPDCTACLALNPVGNRQDRISRLETRRPLLIADAEWKLREQDWHGVADAMMDLGDLDAELKGLRA